MNQRETVAALSSVVVLLQMVGAASAQTQPPPLESLRTPPSPAFMVLAIEPSAVERPTTPSDAALTLVNRFRSGTVPRDFAFETSPYWLLSRPRLTWRDDASRGIPQSIGRTTSFSVATAEAGTDQTAVTSLAVGFRTLLFSGQLTTATRTALEELEKRLGEQGDLFLALMRERGLSELDAALLDCTNPRPPNPTPTDAARQACAADYEAKKTALRDLVLQSDAFREAAAPLIGASNLVPKREGFFLEVAAGGAWDFANADWRSRQFRRKAIWATPSYHAGPWAILGVARYEDDAQTTDDDAIDWGGRAIYSTTDYAVSFEHVERSPLGDVTLLKRTHRLVGIAEYRVSRATWIVASFGKDRERSSTRESTVIAQLGLAFSFSKERYKF